MQIAEFNRDGKLDIALAYPSNGLVTGATTTIVFLPGNNDGTFGAQMNSTAAYPMPTQQNPSFLAANGNVVTTDANLDGNPHLVFGTSAVAIGDGRGNFSGDGAIGNQVAQFADSIGLLQLAESELPSLVFAGNPVAFSCGPAPMSGLSCPPTLSLDAQGNATFQAANRGNVSFYRLYQQRRAGGGPTVCSGRAVGQRDQACFEGDRAFRMALNRTTGRTR